MSQCITSVFCDDSDVNKPNVVYLCCPRHTKPQLIQSHMAHRSGEAKLLVDVLINYIMLFIIILH